jgi:hypothetical protein
MFTTTLNVATVQRIAGLAKRLVHAAEARELVRSRVDMQIWPTSASHPPTT